MVQEGGSVVGGRQRHATAMLPCTFAAAARKICAVENGGARRLSHDVMLRGATLRYTPHVAKESVATIPATERLDDDDGRDERARRIREESMLRSRRFAGERGSTRR